MTAPTNFTISASISGRSTRTSAWAPLEPAMPPASSALPALIHTVLL
jgi:hypothetical protein